jgi:hypothetical protein
MSHMIEGIQVTEDYGSGNLHTKPCKKGDVNHSDVEHGTISSNQ